MILFVIDVESTCWGDSSKRGERHEIIEMGATILRIIDRKLVDVGSFCYFVKPVENPILSTFCKRLTSLGQEDIDTAEIFPGALSQLIEHGQYWFFREVPLKEVIFASWGDYDRHQFEKECDFHKIEYPFGVHWNVKRAFSVKRQEKKCGVIAALHRLGLSFEGINHRGIDDSKNIAKIIRREFGDMIVKKQDIFKFDKVKNKK